MRLGVVFGGQSYEHEVSIISAIALSKVFKSEDVAYIFCDKDRKFYLIDPKNMVASYFKDGAYKTGGIGFGKPKDLHISNGGFYLNGMFSKDKFPVDVYINLIHGCDGEDGKMASLFDFFGIKYIGPRIEASVLSYNKILTKNLAALAGVKTINYAIVKKNSLATFKYPLILKPARLGSSIGIGIVNNSHELDIAMDKAFDLDDTAIVEPYVANIKEYNLAGCKIDGKFIYSNIEEPVKKDYLDFDQKYMDFSRTGKIEPATVGQSVQDNMKEAFHKIYNTGGFDGALIRCDFFVINNEIYLNEINPCPGSMANYLFDNFTEVIKNLANSIELPKEIPVSYDLIDKLMDIK
ncbi:MAG: D-alanine--D-alanine ligase [Campylobacter sp.]|nr:D-alanine--D-alanine ligase [Campylobacter sp.]